MKENFLLAINWSSTPCSYASVWSRSSSRKPRWADWAHSLSTSIACERTEDSLRVWDRCCTCCPSANWSRSTQAFGRQLQHRAEGGQVGGGGVEHSMSSFFGSTIVRYSDRRKANRSVIAPHSSAIVKTSKFAYCFLSRRWTRLSSTSCSHREESWNLMRNWINTVQKFKRYHKLMQIASGLWLNLIEKILVRTFIFPQSHAPVLRNYVHRLRSRM